MRFLPLNLHFLAGQFARLLYPICKLRLIERAFVNVEIAYVLLFRGAGRNRIERRALEERHFDVFREAMKSEKPSSVFMRRAIERRVPFHRFAYLWKGCDDQCIEALSDILFPAGYRRDVSLHGLIAVAFGDLRIAAGEKLGAQRARLAPPLSWRGSSSWFCAVLLAAPWPLRDLRRLPREAKMVGPAGLEPATRPL